MASAGGGRGTVPVGASEDRGLPRRGHRRGWPLEIGPCGGRAPAPVALAVLDGTIVAPALLVTVPLPIAVTVVAAVTVIAAVPVSVPVARPVPVPITITVAIAITITITVPTAVAVAIAIAVSPGSGTAQRRKERSEFSNCQHLATHMLFKQLPHRGLPQEQQQSRTLEVCRPTRTRAHSGADRAIAGQLQKGAPSQSQRDKQMASSRGPLASRLHCGIKLLLRTPWGRNDTPML